MQRGWLVLPLLGLLAASTAQGASLELPFIEGLRRHGYYDYALLEIDRVEARKNLSPELRATLDFERAVTQLQYARSLVNPESQAKELDRAAKSLEQFTRLHPDNPMVSKAYAERGQLLLDRARVELWQLHPDDSSAKQTAARTKARKIIGEARGVFQISHDQAKAAYERFPKIPPSDPKVIEARRQAESSYLRAQLNLAVCTFEEGLTYEPKSSDRKKTLRKAADEFDKIHVNYRSQGAGLRAHLWQGKCFQEEGEPRKALGIYNELIRNDAPNETSRQIRAHATQFRLECLNEQADYTPVVKEVTDWLAALKKNIAPTTTDLGIRWQRAVAAEGLAAAKDTAPGDHERLVKLAAEDAQTVSRYPGEFQMLARAMMTRVGSPSGKKEDVRDFASGLNKARGNMEEIQGILEQMEAAGAEQKAKFQQQLHEKLQSAARQLHGLLAVAEPRTDKKELNRARYYLAFVDYELKENDEAAILAEYASRRLTTLEPDLARDSARLALAAYEQEFNSRPDAQRVTMARIAQPVAEYLIRTWPEHDRANEARITMARLLDRSKQPLEAARWYAGVLESSDQYAEAQVGAGREYWIAAQTAPKQTPGGKPREALVNEWTTQAEKYLRHGIEKAGDPADAAGNPPDWLVVGKVALANLDIGTGRYDEAAKLLSDPPHSVVESIAVTDEAHRPGEGVKGRPFASYVYQTLLRLEIGRHRVDAAMAAMQQLEKIAGATGAEGVTAIYVSLGKEIEKEIARLIASKDRARLTEVRKSFEKFLEELVGRSSSMTYGSLLWIAETYAGLGEGMSEDPNAAREYFAKASRTYDQLIERVAADASAPPDRALSLQLRLANCLRRQGDYERSVQIVRSVIAKKPKALDVQILAADILEDWGSSGDAAAEEKSLAAISGLRDANGGGTVWGWAEIAARLQRILAGGKADNEFREKYFDARYNIPRCRRNFALSQKDPALRKKALNVALGEINAFALVSADVGDDSWRRLDDLYQGIERDLGQPETPLRKPDLRNAGAVDVPTADEKKEIAQAKTATPAAATPATAQPQSAAPPAPPSKGWMLLGFAGVIVAGGLIVWNMRRQQSTRKTFPSFAASDAVDLPGRPATRRPRSPSGSPKPDGSAPSGLSQPGSAQSGAPQKNPAAPRKTAKPKPQ